MTREALAGDLLRESHRALLSRWEDFRQAFERRDGAAYRAALGDFLSNLRAWTGALEEILVPALASRTAGRAHLSRELRLDFVQLRELSRHLLDQIEKRAPLADVLGLVENLDRRMKAHGVQIDDVYAPAAEIALDAAAWERLRAAAPEA